MNPTISHPLAREEQESSKSRPDIKQLTRMAARGLVPMLDESRQLFCYRLVRGGHGLVREGLSPRYTVMTLLGLRQLQSAGEQSPIDTAAIYRSFASDRNWIRSAGDLGLFFWLVGDFEPEAIGRLTKQVDLHVVLERYSDAREGRTMELAWLLTGLARAAETSPQFAQTFADLARETYRRLKENQGRHGLFGHMNVRKSLAGRLRGRIGSFADQIYPIYAISKFAKVFHVEEELDSALQCAMAICRAQGNLGQWWWLYDSRSGHVSSRYPVYSVHQHGMAPMGLLALEEATGCNFQRAIYKGLRWIYGANELGVDMRDSADNLIWRCVLPKNKLARYREMALSGMRPPKPDQPVGPLEVLYEDRPYELGWLLFAFARNTASPANGHSATRS
jgi:hypothetical protein